MNILNKTQVDEIFKREAVLIGRTDNVPDYRVEELFGVDAVSFIRRLGKVGEYVNGFGVGDLTLSCVTYRGFQLAATYYNVRQLQHNTGDRKGGCGQ